MPRRCAWWPARRGDVGSRRRPVPTLGRRATGSAGAVFNALHSLAAVVEGGSRTCSPAAARSASRRSPAGPPHARSSNDDRTAIAVIEANLGSLWPGRRHGRAGRRMRWLEAHARTVRPGAGDPPYAFDDWPALLATLDAGLAVLESDRPIEPGPGWVVRDRGIRRYRGDVRGAGGPALNRSRPPTELLIQRSDRGKGVVSGVVRSDPQRSPRDHRDGGASVRRGGRRGHAQPPEGRARLHARGARGDDRGVVAHLDNVSVTMFSGLVVDLAQEVGADFIVKGLRASSDFEDELQMAQMNNAVAGVHTVFIPSASRTPSSRRSTSGTSRGSAATSASMVPPAVSQAAAGEVRPMTDHDDEDDRSSTPFLV